MFWLSSEVSSDSKLFIQILHNTIMKYCHDCLTPIKSDSKEEYCTICKKDRALKERSTA